MPGIRAGDGRQSHSQNLSRAPVFAYQYGYSEYELFVILTILSGDANIDIFGDELRSVEYTAVNVWAWADRPTELWVEGDMEGDALFKMEVWHMTSTIAIPIATDTVLVKVASVDLDVDSDNNDGVGAPSRSALEELLEDGGPISGGQTHPGKVILTNTLDRTGNGIPDFADGYNRPGGNESDDVELSSKGYMAQVQLPTWVDRSQANIRFRYVANDPNVPVLVTVNGDRNTYETQTPDNAYIRLWTKDLDERRDRASINDQAPGDFVPGNVVMTADRLFTGEGHVADLFVEGVHGSPDGGVRIQFELDPFGTGRFLLTDTVILTSAWIQLVYTDASGITGDAWDTVTRIAPNIEPDGLAADWHPEIDDGSMLYMRVVGSEILDQFVLEQALSVDFGWLNQFEYESGLPQHDSEYQGAYLSLTEIHVQRLNSEGIRDPDDNYVSSRYRGTGSNALKVLDERLYRPPYEFDLSDPGNHEETRKVYLAVELAGNTVQATGAKPESAVTITRAPVVLVHGINSGADTWASGDDNMLGFLLSANYDVLPISYGTAERGNIDLPDAVTTLRGYLDSFKTAIQTGMDQHPEVTAKFPGRILAVQKFDVVAHSYGGLVSRWYTETDAETYDDRRDVRKIITLGTPHQGSPLANLIVEIYKQGLIAEAQATPQEVLQLASVLAQFFGLQSIPSPDNILELVQIIDNTGLMNLTSATSNLDLLPAYRSLAVESDRLTTLNDGSPFRSDIAYANVSGIDSDLYGLLNLFDLLEPFQGSTERSYFPWITNGAFIGWNDGVVPYWSANIMPVGMFEYRGVMTHLDMQSNSAVNVTVRDWLSSVDSVSNDAGHWLPTGGDADGPRLEDVPNGVRNAFDKDGLNPQAIVKTSLPPTETVAVFYDAKERTFSATDTGAQSVIATGMIQPLSVDGLTLRVFVLSVGDYFLFHEVPVSLGELHLEGASGGPWDFQTFRIDLGRIGRGVQQLLRGPNGAYVSASQPVAVYYRLENASQSFLLDSPTIAVVVEPLNLLPIPKELSPLLFQLNGVAVVSSGGYGQSGQTTQEIDIYVYDEDIEFDDELDHVVVTVDTTDLWVGLLVDYSAQTQLHIDGSGYVAGPSGHSGEPEAELYQWVDPLQSEVITVP